MLESDPRRQAIYSLRGYAYQIWQSLYEWASLEEGEILYLEGAEDIDKMSHETAETIQVKDIEHSVTLNSSEIRNSITNYWGHKKRNPDIKIRYRFLTTAERGKEHASPFGDNKGLDYWDECKRKETDLTTLRAFLLTMDSLDEQLRSFIKTASDARLRSELINSIEWDTGNPKREYLEELINRKLIIYGSRYQIAPSESIKTLDALLKIVFEKACNKDNRELTLPDLLLELESQTSINMPMSVMRTAVNALSTQFERILSSNTLFGTAVEMSIFAQDISPALPERSCRREKLVSAFVEKIKENKILILSGSTGMGKSTLGTLLIEKLKFNFKWINFRGNKPNVINSILWQTVLEIHKCDDTIYFVDDIPFGLDFTTYENALVAFINTVLINNGYIIITTQDLLPESLSDYVHAENLTEYIPQLTLEEIKELSALYGCPQDNKSDIWSNFILIKTGGHPLLVHAKIRNLASNKWPDPRIEDLTSADFETIKAEIQKRLIADVPYEPARILLYRLSILLHPFLREHAIIMGEKSPQIVNCKTSSIFPEQRQL